MTIQRIDHDTVARNGMVYRFTDAPLGGCHVCAFSHPRDAAGIRYGEPDAPCTPAQRADHREGYFKYEE